MKFNFKEMKGITLIALVITIIVLLILAGVSIATLTGDNGILTKAQKAKTETDKSNIKEQIELAVLNSRINDNLDASIDLGKLDEGIHAINGITGIDKQGDEGSLPWIVTAENKYKFQITEDGEVEEINGISLSQTTLKMVAGQDPVTITETLTEGVTGTITWTSSDTNVITVNNGTITLVGTSGTAKITAKVDGTEYSAECIVTIVAKVTAISVSDLTIEQGNTEQLTVTTTPSGTDIEDLEYISLDTTGKITVNTQGKVTVASDATVGGTATITVKGKNSGTTGTCTITVKQAKLPIGDYVEYNASYTDMYVADIDTTTDGNQGFTATNGWRILDPGTKNSDGSYSGAKIISTGIPAKLYYRYNTGSDWQKIGSTNVPSWWGTNGQVTELFGSSFANKGFIYENGGCPSYYASAGLIKNFALIPFEAKTSDFTPNIGGYKAIINGG